MLFEYWFFPTHFIMFVLNCLDSGVSCLKSTVNIHKVVSSKKELDLFGYICLASSKTYCWSLVCLNNTIYWLLGFIVLFYFPLLYRFCTWQMTNILQWCEHSVKGSHISSFCSIFHQIMEDIKRSAVRIYFRCRNTLYKTNSWFQSSINWLPMLIEPNNCLW